MRKIGSKAKNITPREKKPKGHQISPALMKIAKNDIDKFEQQSDEAFLARAEMAKKLSSL